MVDHLNELRIAAATGIAPPPCPVSLLMKQSDDVLAWLGPDGGEERLRTLVPMFTHSNGVHRANVQWAMVSTHIPGRSGRECRDRWFDMMREDEESSNDDGDDAAEPRERCVVLGCKRQLLRCHGVKEAGHAVGCAEESHVLCYPCLEKWFLSQNELRQQQGLPGLTRRSCPVCKSELRSTSGEVRAGEFVLGLQKLGWSWE